MKSIIYAFLFLTLPISMAGKDSTAIKADNPAATKAAKQEEIKTPPAPSIVKHDTVYVAVKEMPEENAWTLPTIITIILAAISLFTLFEMKTQRKAAYRPELILKSDEFFITKANEKIYHGKIKHFESNEERYYSLNHFCLQLLNLGHTAKNIKINFSYNLKLIENILNDAFEISDNKILLDYKVSNNDHKSYELPIRKIQSKYPPIDFLPSSAERNTHSVNIDLPFDYFLLFTHLITIQGDVYSIRRFLKDYVPMVIGIEYFDIHNERYYDEFQVIPVPYYSFSEPLATKSGYIDQYTLKHKLEIRKNKHR